MPERIITDADFADLKAKRAAVDEAWYARLKLAGEPPVPAPPTPAGTAWLSGVAHDAATIQKWGAFRGSPATYARVWADSDRNNMLNLYSMADVTATGWDGVLDVAIGGPSDWFSAATGGWDSTWRAQCRKALSLWGNLRQLHLSMAHEFNNAPTGSSYAWKVTSASQASFRTAWARWARIVREEMVTKGSAVKIVLSCNSDTNGGWTLAGGLPDSAAFDILGVDPYNFWPSLLTAAAWESVKGAMKGDVPRGVQAWIDLATKLGKPISFPEWGLAPSGDFPVDTPVYVQKMHETFARIAPVDPYNPGPGKLAGEAFFNAWSGHGQIFPTAVNATNARAAYTSLRWGTT